jgi:hypothetical protein
MKHVLLKSLALVAIGSVATPTPGHAQQVLIPETASQVPGPAPGTAMTKAYVQTVGRAAYLWGWAPPVSEKLSPG